MAKKHKHTTDDPNHPDASTDGAQDDDESPSDPIVGIEKGDEPPSPLPENVAAAPHGSTAMAQGAGDYHPNPDMANAPTSPQNSAPYLDADTHDFGPAGGEDQCRICGKTRAELGLKIGKPLTEDELEHPSVKDANLLPPRLR